MEMGVCFGTGTLAVTDEIIRHSLLLTAVVGDKRFRRTDCGRRDASVGGLAA